MLDISISPSKLLLFFKRPIIATKKITWMAERNKVKGNSLLAPWDKIYHPHLGHPRVTVACQSNSALFTLAPLSTGKKVANHSP
jgi:hypothetical protein